MTAKNFYSWIWAARMWDMKYSPEKITLAEPKWTGDVKILTKKTRKRSRRRKSSLRSSAP